MELRSLLLCAAVLGLAIGAMLACLEAVQAEQPVVYVYRSDGLEIAPADVSALIEEARRITGESAGDA